MPASGINVGRGQVEVIATNTAGPVPPHVDLHHYQTMPVGLRGSKQVRVAFVADGPSRQQSSDQIGEGIIPHPELFKPIHCRPSMGGDGATIRERQKFSSKESVDSGRSAEVPEESRVFSQGQDRTVAN
jgi:hypothetical protein